MTIKPRMVKKIHPSGSQEWRALDYPTPLAHVMHMAQQAVDAYGTGVMRWPARKLEKTVWRGKSGMRSVQYDEQYELDDMERVS